MHQCNKRLHPPSTIVTPLAVASGATTGRYAPFALAGEAGVW